MLMSIAVDHSVSNIDPFSQGALALLMFPLCALFTDLPQPQTSELVNEDISEPVEDVKQQGYT